MLKSMKLTTAQRNRLPSSAFAIPELRWGPLVDRTHVANAASRLAQAHNAGRLSGRQYAEAKKRIARAERHYGIHGAHENPLTMKRSWKNPEVLGGAAVGAVLGAALMIFI
jgi:hypothetical protein